jgi:NAD(P)-dependent dehydrogenase (short-subunit alcohol dehydrogenase family)
MVRQDCDRLNVLINNAGIGSGGSAGKRETSLEGYELRFAVNYLAGFLLTRLLLPLARAGTPLHVTVRECAADVLSPFYDFRRQRLAYIRL